MKRLSLILVSILFALQFANAQNGVSISSTNADPDGSAMLDVQSTDKGMLIPRVALTGTSDATTIASPAVSLMVYNTATVSDVTPGFYYWNGTAWITMGGSATTSPTYAIGLNEDLGGYVFYVSPDGRHGLVAATQDQSTSCSWYNAQDIISNSANHSTAGKNFTDWRLPTKYELNLMYGQKANIGGFTTGYYWCSTEFGYSSAWVQGFSDGFQDVDDKNYPSYVRAVRAF